jgi:hypothetical protein
LTRIIRIQADADFSGVKTIFKNSVDAVCNSLMEKVPLKIVTNIFYLLWLEARSQVWDGTNFGLVLLKNKPNALARPAIGFGLGPHA